MKERGSFRSNSGFLMAAIGSAVGLGNIWGFPYKMGKGGGFAFLLIYLLLAALCGAVVLLGELALGRRTGGNAITAYRQPSRTFRWVGYMAPVTSVLILAFYSALGGYCIRYLLLNVGSLFGAEWGTNGLDGASLFSALLTDQPVSVICGMAFLLITAVIVLLGVRGGIERFCSVGMPLLLAMLLVIILRACTLPGAGAGLVFMFKPDLTPLREDFLGVLKTAGGQMFFSLSIASGVMVTYGSYLGKREDLGKNTVIIVLSDTLVGLLAGMAVLPAAFALGAPEDAMQGPALLFVTLQDVFGSMGRVGYFFGVMFYLLVVLAALASSVSMLEVPVAYFTDRAMHGGKRQTGAGKPRRWLYVLAVTVVSGVLCAVTCADGLGSNGLWVPLQSLFSGGAVPTFCDCWLDLLDFISEGLLMPLGALFTCLMIGWELKPDWVQQEVMLEGRRFGLYRAYYVCVRYITPLIMLFILWGQLKTFLNF